MVETVTPLRSREFGMVMWLRSPAASDLLEMKSRIFSTGAVGGGAPSKKTAALEKLAKEVFGELRFDDFKNDIGIVGTRWQDGRSIIFKTNRKQAFTGARTFEPGFGCTIADALVGSCSAYPFFLRKLITTGRGDRIVRLKAQRCAVRASHRQRSACRARKSDPSSASNFAPFERRCLAVALGSSELAWVAETRRARVA